MRFGTPGRTQRAPYRRNPLGAAELCRGIILLGGEMSWNDSGTVAPSLPSR